jgi:tricorn protease
MLRYPTVSATEVAFVYAGKLWRAPRKGGVATPVAAPAGPVRHPRFSRDGKTIAFTANYEGNDELYTIPTEGGEPTRVTHHPGVDRLCGWAAEGYLLYTNRQMATYPSSSKVLTVSAKGGNPMPLPVPYGEDAALSPDGKVLAYTPSSTNDRTWKRYRGGWAQDLWLFDLTTKAARKITDWEGTDTLPMWEQGGKALFYLSDNGPEHRLNLWKYELATGKRRQLTKYTDYDLKWPSIGGGAIVFQHGAELVLLDTKTEATTSVKVTIPGDRPALRPKVVDASKYLTSLSLAPSARRVALAARGDIWTAPAKEGTPRNLTRTSGVHEHSPRWSPDGKTIAYLSDATGEYELYTMPADGKGTPKQLTKDGNTYRIMGSWSPDSKHLTLTDKTGALFLVEAESGKVTKVDQNPTGGPLSPSWSSDSQWLTYAYAADPRQQSVISLYSLERGQKTAVTSGMFSDFNPVFDRKGEWLYFVSSRSFRAPTYDENMTTWVYTNTQVLIAVPLRDDIASPYLAKSDEEPATEPKPSAEPKKTSRVFLERTPPTIAAATADDISGTWMGRVSGTPQGDLEVTVVLTLGGDGTTLTGTMAVAGLGSANLSGTFNPTTKAVELTATGGGFPTVQIKGKLEGNRMTLTGVAEGLALPINLTRQGGNPTPQPPPSGGDKPAVKPAADAKIVPVKIDLEGFESRAMQLPIPTGTFGQLAVNAQNQLLYVRNGKGIQLFDLNDATRTEKVVNAGAGNFDLTADGAQLLVPSGTTATIQAASAGSAPAAIVTSGMEITVDVRAEWRELLRDAWRIERDYFYDPTMHGVDWPGVLKQYEAMLPDAASRADVGYLIRELISELNVGHTYYSPSDDEETAPTVGVGMLGCDFTLESGAYRIGKIYRGGPWDTDAKGPLSLPGIKIRTGDYVLAVNGVPVDVSKDIWAAFVGRDNKVVTVTVSSKPTLDKDARDVPIRLLGGDMNLRFRDWIESNRKLVDKLSGGKVGYIYVPDTGTNGQAELVRQFVGQLGKEALLIDERWNGGGQIPTRFIELLNRPVTNYWALRDGKDVVWPPDGHTGPKAMLINGLAGSGGDAFPYYFKQAGLGKLIGTRTWGGLVGISGTPSMLDGSNVTAPDFAFYENDGTWGIEGHGVDPDIEVLDDPSKMQEGRDPQLEAGIKHLLEELKKKPYTAPKRPAYPNRGGMGSKKEDR